MEGEVMADSMKKLFLQIQKLDRIELFNEIEIKYKMID